MKLEFSRRIFEKSSNIGFYKKKILPVGAELFNEDRRTDRHNEANCCISEYCDNAKKKNSTFCPQSGFCVDLRANKDYFRTHY